VFRDIIDCGHCRSITGINLVGAYSLYETTGTIVLPSEFAYIHAAPGAFGPVTVVYKRARGELDKMNSWGLSVWNDISSKFGRYHAYSEISEDVSSRLMSAANSTKYDRDIDCCG
jgi:hypothetical protein